MQINDFCYILIIILIIEVFAFSLAEIIISNIIMSVYRSKGHYKLDWYFSIADKSHFEYQSFQSLYAANEVLHVLSMI